MTEHENPKFIQIRNARVHNLKHIDLDIPLNKTVAIAGVSGSGKSSLAMGVLYAEGSRRYLDALSAYTRRRMTNATGSKVDQVLYIPAALALHQRPGVPGIRSTFGTGTELLNNLRLMFSRLSAHCCPNGHRLEPSLAVAAGQALVCPVCQERFFAPSAEELAFNSQGACHRCGGTGVVQTVNLDSLVPDDSLTIDQGAVLPWKTLMWSLMTQVCGAMGVRTDVPFRDLTEEEKRIVYHGPAEKKHIFYKAKNSNDAAELDFTYFNAVYTVENALAKVKDEKGMKRVERFLIEGICPECGGTRLCKKARIPQIQGLSLDEACELPLEQLCQWVEGIEATLPQEMRPLARELSQSFQHTADRLIELGLGYLSLSRSTASLSTGERQRMQLARAVRSRTTGILYILDEPSIGLHPANLQGLKNLMKDLVSDGNSLILVDHDPQLLAEADWLIEMGPEAGNNGGTVIAQGTVAQICQTPCSQIGPFLAGTAIPVRKMSQETSVFADGAIEIVTNPIYTVKPLHVQIPIGRLSVVTGVSGSGKTTFVLESLIPALEASIHKKSLPAHVQSLKAPEIRQIKLIDATPIGLNVRSTIATYTGIHDELRKVFGRVSQAKEKGYRASDFSYNTGKLRCPLCDGTGTVNLDIQFLPDVELECPQCHGNRYSQEADSIFWYNPAGEAYTLPQIMAMEIRQVLQIFRELPSLRSRLHMLTELGLGYLTLGEATTALSGGEAQRLKLASELGKQQNTTVFAFDEPTIGLHPSDVQTLMGIFDRLVAKGATVIVIEHDLDLIRNADYIIDMGPGGGESGGRIVAAGIPEQVRNNKESITGRYL